MKLQRLYSLVRQAMDQYHMVEEGDKIAIGISGGKDSLTLLYALAGLRRFYPKSFDLVAITVDLGYDGFDTSKIRDLCESLDVEYHVVKTQIGEMVSDGQCSLCARLRKGALMEEALRLSCNAIAYAHNLDDVVETMMMALIYEGRFVSFWPVTHFEDNGMKVIRPLIFTEVSDVIGFSNKMELPISKNPCPYDGITKRTYVRQLLAQIDHEAPGVRQRMMTAIRNSEDWRKI